jgi:hypothetical protein
LLRGTVTSMFLRLCSRAPRMTMESIGLRGILTAGWEEGVPVYEG